MIFLRSLHRKAALILILLVLFICWFRPSEAASLRLTWNDTASNETGFKVERLAGNSFTQIGTVGANMTSYTDSGLTSGVTYCYRVRAYNSRGTSSPSNRACGNATAGGGTVSVGGSTGGSTSGRSTGTGSSSTRGRNATSQEGANWSDYRFTVKIRSMDNDAVGVMFRYLDNRNYYRFSWDTERTSRRLEKFRNGGHTVLAQDTVPYVTGRTYELQIVAQGQSLKVRIDGVQIFSVTDASFDEGTVALYSWYNKGSVFDNVLVQDLTTGDVLLSNNFNDGNVNGWTIIDEGPSYGPSRWSAAGDVLAQTSNIGGGNKMLGSYALYTKKSWADYRVSLKIKSMDNDAIGAMFRYADNRNYYRFSWDKEQTSRRLEKFRNGARTVLAEDTVPYITGRTYELQISARGTTLEVRIDGVLIFSVLDSSLDAGTVALYNWYNQGSIFDDILVEDLLTGEALLWDDFDDGNFIGWTTVDEGPESGPSVWSVKNGAFAQTRNIGDSRSKKLGTFALY